MVNEPGKFYKFAPHRLPIIGQYVTNCNVASVINITQLLTLEFAKQSLALNESFRDRTKIFLLAQQSEASMHYPYDSITVSVHIIMIRTIF